VKDYGSSAITQLDECLGASLSKGSLEGRVGILDHSPVQLADLRCLRNESVVSPLHILRLDFDGLLKRLRSDELLFCVDIVRM
jgi:hypothetical protein